MATDLQNLLDQLDSRKSASEVLELSRAIKRAAHDLVRNSCPCKRGAPKVSAPNLQSSGANPPGSEPLPPE